LKFELKLGLELLAKHKQSKRNSVHLEGTL